MNQRKSNGNRGAIIFAVVLVLAMLLALGAFYTVNKLQEIRATTNAAVLQSK